MTLPFDEFPASQATVDLASGTISYEEAGALAAGSTTLGEALAVTGEVAAAAVVAEPLLIVGAGLAAGMAAEAILNKLNPSAPKPQYRNNRATGGRIGGNYIVEFMYKVQGRAETTNSVYANGPIEGIRADPTSGGGTNWVLVAGGTTVGLLEADPTVVEQQPQITNITKNDGSPSDGPLINPSWDSPGGIVLPTPTPRNIAIPGLTDPYPITPYVLPSQRRQPGTQPQTPVSPGVTVWVPELGLVVNYNPTNVNIVFTQPATTGNIIAPPIQVDTKFHYPENPCHCPDANTAEIICRLKRLQTDLLDNGYTYNSVAGPTGESGTVDGITDPLYAVEIDVNTKPSNARTEYGGGNAPDLVYSGWLEWRRNGRCTTRQRIDFLNTVHFAPSGADGFAYTVYGGFSASSSYITKVKKPYVDNC